MSLSWVGFGGRRRRSRRRPHGHCWAVIANSSIDGVFLFEREEDAEAFGATWVDAFVAELPVATPDIARDLISGEREVNRKRPVSPSIARWITSTWQCRSCSERVSQNEVARTASASRVTAQDDLPCRRGPSPSAWAHLLHEGDAAHDPVALRHGPRTAGGETTPRPTTS
jgi:hypothetical protein